MEESVTALRHAIKEELRPDFNHIPADSLVLWKASVPLNRNFKEHVEALDLIDDNALQPFEFLSDILPSELKKRTVHIVVDRPPPAISRSSFLQLFCYVKGEHYKRAFKVKIGREESVAALKEAIKEKRKPDFDHVRAASLVLWNVKIPLDEHLKEAVDKLGLVDENLLLPCIKLSNVVSHQPADGHLYIVVKDISIAPRWLVEIHRKLWGRHDLFGQIFRTANLTKADFIELQCRLQEQNPDRNSESYVAMNVLATKSAFLRSRSAPFGAGFGDGLVPRLGFDASQGLTQPPSADVVDDDADAAMVIDPDPGSSDCSYIYSDADCLSTGATAIFPCTIQYMDLTVLELENNIRVPQLTLFRQEWGNMVDIFNKREKGIRGSAAFTGQPGIGKTCLLYSILIHCIIRAKPIVFQDMNGKVFIINDTMRKRKRTPYIPGDEVLTLVDAHGASCQPDPYLFDACNLRILQTSPPRNIRKRRWLTQSVGETGAVFVMEPWSREELLVASSFLAGIDITPRRFQRTSDICGLIPRSCFEAAVSLGTLRDAADAISDAIKETEDLSRAIVIVHSRATMHPAFQIRPPSPTNRGWYCSLTEAVSDWAFSEVMAYLDQRSAEAAYEFYRDIQWADNSLLGRKMFETKLHAFFRTITEPRSFTIHSLDDHSTTLDIKFSSDTEHLTFGDVQHFEGQLESSIRGNKSCYLKPLSPVFPTFDSFLYQHGSGCSPLIGLQITTTSKHPISIKGLVEVQKSLTHLKALRPSKLIVLFVVPDTIGASFVKRKIKEAEKEGHWYEKYILTLPEQEVFQCIQ